MKRITRLFYILFATATLTVAGCAVNPNAQEEGTTEGIAAPAMTSPATERVLGGVAEMVLTDRPWPGFDEARANPIESVVDGSPLYVYIRANRPLGELAHPADPSGSYTFSDYPHLFLQIGDNQSLRILNTCYVTLSVEEVRGRELVVPLAPLANRPGQVPADCWLTTTTSSRAGKQVFEVRLAGFAGRFDSWLPVPDLLAVTPVPTDLSGGAGVYAAMLKATPMRGVTLLANAAAAATGTPVDTAPTVPSTTAVATPIRAATLVATNTAPLPGQRQDIGSSRLELQLQSLSAAMLGRRPSEVYFVDRNWINTTDQRGRIVQQHAFAAAVFKGASCSWIPLKAFRRPGSPTLTDVEQAGEPIEVDCTDL